MTAGQHFRLVAERAGAGPHQFPRVFGSVEEAAAYAEANIDRLAAHFGWRVRGFRVVELPGLRVVTTVVWHDPVYDPDPFAQPDPPAAGGASGPGEGERQQALPAAEAPPPHPEHRPISAPRWRM